MPNEMDVDLDNKLTTNMMCGWNNVSDTYAAPPTDPDDDDLLGMKSFPSFGESYSNVFIEFLSNFADTYTMR